MMECTWKDLENKVRDIELSEKTLQAANIVLFGAGMNGEFACENLSRTYPITAFADNNPALWGKTLKGIRIIEPAALKQIDNLMVIITVTGSYYTSIKTQLNVAGVRYITYAEYVIAKYFKEFETVHDRLLEDSLSQKTYRNILMSHLLNDAGLLKAVSVRDQYFAIPEFTVPSGKEVFVDCGAYVGDTMEKYLFQKTGIFKRMYLFEPAEKMCCALNGRRERLIREWALEKGKIIIENKAVSDENKCIAFSKGQSTTNRNIGGGMKKPVGRSWQFPLIPTLRNLKISPHSSKWILKVQSRNW